MRDAIGLLFRPAKNQCAVEICSLEQRHEQIEFLFRCHGIDSMSDGFRRRTARADFNHRRIVQDPRRQTFDLRRKVAEKSSVCRSVGIFSTIRRTSGRKPMSSIRSTSSSTRIFTSLQIHRALLKQIEQAPRCGDEDVHAVLQFFALFPVTDAPMHESATRKSVKRP